ncbi:peptidoglycan hydrolase [Enterococcus faecium]|uniref:phage tail tip lysozyme n=1 Tax=Enterococcus faecium TaxID=1352 RepID=UPI000CF313BE|nr:phage tail tip lysozyme [Enterococcus faecium]PQG48435.1 peptidoglycan hydrolase [Enterococcus faecium]
MKKIGCGCLAVGCLPMFFIAFFVMFSFFSGDKKSVEDCIDYPEIEQVSDRGVEENARATYNFLRKNFGATPEGASGVLGCLQFESQFNPKAENPSSGAYGIAQWLGGRLTRLEQLAQEMGKDKGDLTVQLQLLGEELKNPYYKKALKALQLTNVHEAQKEWLLWFEGLSQDPSQWHLEKRNAMADQWFAKFGSSDVVASEVSDQTISGDGNIVYCDSEGAPADGDILEIAKGWLGWFHYEQIHPSPDLGTDLKNPNKEGRTDCSGYVWLVLNKAGYNVPANMQWYTGSMTSDARGAKQYLREISESEAQAGDIIIVNQGGGAGSNGHTGILVEKWTGHNTKVIQEGGNGDRVNIEAFGTSFTSLIPGGDICFARPVKK